MRDTNLHYKDCSEMHSGSCSQMLLCNCPIHMIELNDGKVGEKGKGRGGEGRGVPCDNANDVIVVTATSLEQLQRKASKDYKYSKDRNELLRDVNTICRFDTKGFPDTYHCILTSTPM